MLSVLVLLFLALAVPVKANASVSDMDLLSGVPTVLAAVAAFIQILPSPVKVFRGRVTHFVEWLQRSIETDFDVSLYSCTKKCMTQTYDANLEAIERRVRVNSGVADTVGCAGTALLTTEEAVAIIQNGSGRTLMCLARAARYPYVDRLETAVRVIRHAPMSGRRVIFWQWAAMSVPYFFSWCFRHGLPRWFYWAFLILRNILRRWRRLMPRERQRSGKINMEYRMAALARHKMDAQHVPFVRFALYVMLMLESGKYVSIRKGVANNTDKQRPADADSNWQLGNEEKFRHPCIDARTLALRVATDECSAVRLLYASALHSMRVVLLGQQHQGGYAPPYVVTSSFRAAICHLQNTMLVVSHGSIDTVFQCLLQGKARGHFDLLLKHMQSRLGSHVLRKTECQILLNMALLPLELRVIAPKDNVGPSTQPSRVPTTYEVDGKVILPEQYKQLCRAQCTLLEELDTELENFASPDLYWGPHPWLLRMLFISISRAKAFDVDKGCKDKYKFVKLLRVKIKMLCFSPYQLRFGLESNETLDNFYDLGTRFGNEDELDSPDFCRSMPAWCLCTSHCRGICTLIVNKLEMKIVVKGYFNQPYLFTATSDPEKPPPTKDGNSISANSGESSIRLMCAVRLDNLGRNFEEIGKGNTGPAHCRRFDPTVYILSTFIYADRPILLVARGDTLYKAELKLSPTNNKYLATNNNPSSANKSPLPTNEGSLPTNNNPSSANDIPSSANNNPSSTINKSLSTNECGSWPHNEWLKDIKKKAASGNKVTITKTEKLQLNTDDLTAQSTSRQVNLSQGHLEYELNRETKNRLTLEAPYRSIS